MTDKPLHVQVAEALGWTPIDHRILGERWRAPGDAHPEPEKRVPRYDTDWSATGPLIERYRIHLGDWNHATGEHAWWYAAVWGPGGEYGPERTEETKGYETPLIAVCNLILALKAAGKLNP